MPTLGPENPTLSERIVSVFRLPYLWRALLLSAIIGPPGQFLFAYLDTRSLQDAFTVTFNIPLGLTGELTTEQGILNQSLWLATLFAIIYMTRFMRLKLVSSEPELISLSPEGEETLHKAFHLVPRLIPQLVLVTIMAVVNTEFILSPIANLQDKVAMGSVYTAWVYVYSILVWLIFVSFVWTYASSLWGLHKLGKEPLRLKPYHEDSMLGARPVGHIALTLFASYFTVTGLGTLTFLSAPDPGTSILLTLLLILGVAMFFLPLNSIHQHMQQTKHLQQTAIRKQFAQLHTSPDNPKPKTASQLLTRLTELQALQMRGDEASKIPTWPLDTTILTRFAAIILSLLIVIISRIILLALGLG